MHRPRKTECFAMMPRRVRAILRSITGQASLYRTTGRCQPVMAVAFCARCRSSRGGAIRRRGPPHDVHQATPAPVTSSMRQSTRGSASGDLIRDDGGRRDISPAIRTSSPSRPLSIRHHYKLKHVNFDEPALNTYADVMMPRRCNT